MAKKKKPVAVKQDKGQTRLLLHLVKVVAATIILIVFVLLAGLAVLILFPVHGPDIKATTVKKIPAATGIVFEIYPREKKPLRPPPGEAAGPLPEAAGPKPLVAIIIDDIGYDRFIAKRLIALDPALTLSILPHSPFNREIADAAHAAGLEIMLHLPMEPMEYPAIDPGPGVLLTTMPPDTLLASLAEDLADVPYIKGVNNHMGSRLTAESIQLYQIFSVLKKQGLFFIDSCTTKKTLCEPSAGKLQVPFARRDVFLDNSLSEADIKRQLNLLLDIARQKGKAIGIGHPHPETFKVLEQVLPSIKKQAQLVPVSEVVQPAI